MDFKIEYNMYMYVVQIELIKNKILNDNYGAEK